MSHGNQTFRTEGNNTPFAEIRTNQKESCNGIVQCGDSFFFILFYLLFLSVTLPFLALKIDSSYAFPSHFNLFSSLSPHIQRFTYCPRYQFLCAALSLYVSCYPANSLQLLRFTRIYSRLVSLLQTPRIATQPIASVNLDFFFLSHSTCRFKFPPLMKRAH